MFWDWLSREGWIIFIYWLMVTLAGAAAFPLCARLLGGLSDRGYTLSRAAGLLLVAFTYWLLVSLGFLHNSAGSVVLAWIIVLVISLLAYFRLGERVDWRAWWHENRRVVVVGEILFILLLFGWSVVRAHQNGLTGTEKPMDLAFMSAVQRSETFPPNDPWMAGYAISYYYFGYVISAMLSMSAGIWTTIGYNMNIAVLFALTGLTGFGVVYNLVRSRAFHSGGERLEKAPSQTPALLTGLLGMAFVIFLGNFQLPLVEAPYNMRIASAEYLQFWDVNLRQTPLPPVEGGVDVSRWEFWWWFRAARALNDRNLDGQREEVIDEFPQFSFLLADSHPHVMALPYATLALGLALNILLLWRKPSRAEVVFYGVAVGALVFLNTWDGPVYMLILIGADGLRRLIRSGRLTGGDWLDLLVMGLSLTGLAVVLYLPFLVGFRSQLGGALPNLVHPTLFRQYFLMFGPFILILGAFLAVEIWRAGSRMNWMLGLQVAVGLLIALVVIMLALVLIGSLIPELRYLVVGFVERNGGWSAVLPALLGKRVTHLLTTLVLLIGTALVAGRLFPRLRSFTLQPASEDDRLVVTYPPASGFALLLIGAGLVLTLVPEFVYLRDNFGTRMNTIFKFYYQAWLVFSVAGAYAIYSILVDYRQPFLRPELRSVFGGMTAIVLLMGLAYPVLGIHNRMFIESGRANLSNARQYTLPEGWKIVVEDGWRVEKDTPLMENDSSTQKILSEFAGHILINNRTVYLIPLLTLDGGPTMINADDYEAIMCLKSLVVGDDVVVAEAVGPSYRPQYGRVGALTGLPVVIGWEGHEAQWRGAGYSEIAGTRSQDMIRLFTDLRWEVAQPILAKYGIDYVMYGFSEKYGQYNDDISYNPAGEEKFRENLPVVCSEGDSRIYRVVPQELAARD